MSDGADRDRAASLAREAIGLCDKIGETLASAHLQLGLDRLLERELHGRLKEERSPWGD